MAKNTMIDHQNHFYQEYLSQKQDWAISAWARKKGLSLDDVVNHPCIDDISLLLSVQSEYELEYKSNPRLYATYNALWSGVHSRKRRLNAKGLRRLEIIVTTSESIRQHNNLISQRIQELRTLRQQ
jgi:hypothetical protein